MNLLDIFTKTFETKPPAKAEASSHWIKCKSCHSLMYYKEVENQSYVCPKCGFHLRIGVKERIELLADEGTFIEYDSNLEPVDPINFVDKKPYKKRIEEGFAKTGRKSSVVSGSIKMNDVSAQIVIFDFSFMGGSLGSVEGEKIVRAVNRAIENREGLIILSASGGARMQESTYSLLQMSKTSAALAKLANNNLPYISVLTDPTMGGVSASFATLGDIIIA
ncbi:MAG: acetyl-CoA carboxylase carboxyl transferase subunit beta, partial [Sulfurimonas sp.]|nr:acetyl-CoA carboxylase carboxyl transferase subunit beta [Sulfurimonas sp.]